MNLDPDGLRAAAWAAAALLPALLPPVLDPDDLGVCARVPGGSAIGAEHELLVTAVGRIGWELAELVSALHRAAAVAEAADADAQRVVRRAAEGAG